VRQNSGRWQTFTSEDSTTEWTYGVPNNGVESSPHTGQYCWGSCRLGEDTDTIDTDTHLVELVLGADREAADDLRRLALAPLDQLRPNTAERLAETLRSWLLHRGQRDAVAADLFVHPQTVRYRMTQLRELFGDRLNDPQAVLELIVALSTPTTIDSPAA